MHEKIQQCQTCNENEYDRAVHFMDRKVLEIVTELWCDTCWNTRRAEKVKCQKKKVLKKS